MRDFKGLSFAKPLAWAILLATAAVLFAMSNDASAHPGTLIKPFVTQNMTLVNGTQQYLAIGFTIKSKHIALDLSDGVKMINCQPWQCHLETGSQVGLRMYPFSDTSRLEPMFIYQHTSDLVRGYPFNHEWEPTQDMIGAGLTIHFKKVDVDVFGGEKEVNCPAPFANPSCSLEPTAQAGFRFYLFKNRR